MGTQYYSNRQTFPTCGPQTPPQNREDRQLAIMSSLSPDVEGPEAAARNLCQKLTFMRGRTPSVSAIALNGDVKVSQQSILRM